MGEVVRVFVVDDHEVVRRGLRDLLDAEDDLEVVGDAGSAGMALVGVAHTDPDVALLDVCLPDGSGVELCRQIRSDHPDVACVMLTSYADDEALFDAIMAGAAATCSRRPKAPTWSRRCAGSRTATRCWTRP